MRVLEMNFKDICRREYGWYRNKNSINLLVEQTFLGLQCSGQCRSWSLSSVLPAVLGWYSALLRHVGSRGRVFSTSSSLPSPPTHTTRQDLAFRISWLPELWREWTGSKACCDIIYWQKSLEGDLESLLKAEASCWLFASSWLSSHVHL